MSIENLWPFGRKKKKTSSMPKQQVVDEETQIYDQKTPTD